MKKTEGMAACYTSHGCARKGSMIQAEEGVEWAILDKETQLIVWNDIIAFINCFRSHLLYSFSFTFGYRGGCKTRTNSGEILGWEIESWFGADVALFPLHA